MRWALCLACPPPSAWARTPLWGHGSLVSLCWAVDSGLTEGPEGPGALSGARSGRAPGPCSQGD